MNKSSDLRFINFKERGTGDFAGMMVKKSVPIVPVILLLIFLSGCLGSNEYHPADDVIDDAVTEDIAVYEESSDYDEDEVDEYEVSDTDDGAVDDADDIDPESTETAYAEDVSGTNDNPQDIHSLALVWHVEPTLDHSYISLCNCGSFLNSNWEIIDPSTGLLTNQYHNGHGGGAPMWVYDPMQNLFGHPGYGGGYHTLVGMHPIDAFDETMRDIFGPEGAEWFVQSSNGLIVVQSVDSSQRSDCEWFEGGWDITGEGLTGKFALMYNKVLVTDFIFDAGVQMQRDFGIVNNFEYVSMRIGDQWGLVGNTGNTVLPFIFENLRIIDENTAFAKYNGRYGILDFRRTIDQ